MTLQMYEKVVIYKAISSYYNIFICFIENLGKQKVRKQKRTIHIIFILICCFHYFLLLLQA